MKKLLPFLFAVIALAGCECEQQYTAADAQKFLDEYTQESLRLSIIWNEAEWKSNTRIMEGDTTNSVASRKAGEAYAAFAGSAEVIEKTRGFLAIKDSLTDIQVKQLEGILYTAADNPQTVAEVVKKRIKAETEQNEKLFGYTFMIDGEKVTPNEIDEMLISETDMGKRLKAWEASKEVGKELKGGLENLRNLRNETVQALGYDDFYTYQVSAYDMSVEEMKELCVGMNRDIWPLYRELHTWARYELAARYGQEEVPDLLPAHWMPNRWGQDWAGLVEVEGIDLDGILKEKGDEWLIKQAERFYVSVGFDPLPQSFWEKSSLYPAPKDANWSKNNHASAWHIDLDQDVRCLQSLEPNARWYETTHHELGHIYYFLTYSNKDVPPLLREGANRAYHEAMGSLLGLAAMQQPFLEGLGLVPEGLETDETQILLKEALNYIILIPWGAGVMAEFEHDLYTKNLPVDQFNKRWWELKAKYQGIAPPSERGEEYCDAASKTHINNDPAQYYDYAISFVQLFQMHDYIAKNILNQPPRATNYYGNKKVGDFLKKVMYPGGTRDWRELYKEAVGADLSARPMLDYFAPLLEYLKEVNKGRTYTLPETVEWG